MTFQSAGTRVLQGYRDFIASRADRKPQPHELDPRIAGQAFWVSARGFPKAACSPYVIDKMRKCGPLVADGGGALGPIHRAPYTLYPMVAAPSGPSTKLLIPYTRWVAGPILGMCAVVWLLGWILILPVSLIAHLVGAILPGIDARAVTAAARGGLHSAVGVVAVLAMVVMRKVLHKPIFKCFIHTLRDVNPGLAAELETGPLLPAAPVKPKAAPVKLKAAPRERRLPGERAFLNVWNSRLGRALILALVTHFWRQIPVLRHFAAPSMLFFSAERLLGTERAMLLAGLALLPGLDWPVIQFLDLWRTSLAVGQELLSGALAVIIVQGLGFLDLWRSSLAVGQELLSDYTSRRITGPLRDGFVRSNEVAIFAFLLPQLLMFRLPVVGPLLFLPAAAAAAYLADFLDRLPPNQEFQASAEKSQ